MKSFKVAVKTVSPPLQGIGLLVSYSGKQVLLAKSMWKHLRLVFWLLGIKSGQSQTASWLWFTNCTSCWTKICPSFGFALSEPDSDTNLDLVVTYPMPGHYTWSSLAKLEECSQQPRFRPRRVHVEVSKPSWNRGRRFVHSTDPCRPNSAHKDPPISAYITCFIHDMRPSPTQSTHTHTHGCT